jgi:putative oxidoreductase
MGKRILVAREGGPQGAASDTLLVHPLPERGFDPMNIFMTIFYDWSRAVASYLTWLAPLAVRIVVGWVFLWSGWGKLQVLPRMIDNFREWGIPFPEALTPFVSGMEFLGGLFLLIGLLTRLMSVPMMVIMVVAIISAKWADVDSLETLLGFEEVSYFVMFAWLGIAGPGPISLDHLILKKFRGERPPSDYGA